MVKSICLSHRSSGFRSLAARQWFAILSLQFQEIRSLLLASVCISHACGAQTYMWCTDIHGGTTATHIDTNCLKIKSNSSKRWHKPWRLAFHGWVSWMSMSLRMTRCCKQDLTLYLDNKRCGSEENVVESVLFIYLYLFQGSSEVVRTPLPGSKHLYLLSFLDSPLM